MELFRHEFLNKNKTFLKPFYAFIVPHFLLYYLLKALLYHFWGYIL